MSLRTYAHYKDDDFAAPQRLISNTQQKLNQIILAYQITRNNLVTELNLK